MHRDQAYEAMDSKPRERREKKGMTKQCTSSSLLELKVPLDISWKTGKRVLRRVQAWLPIKGMFRTL